MEVYKENFHHPIIKCDLSELNNDYSIFQNLNPDIIIGGPPCQDFSHAGKRNEDLGRGNLTISYSEILMNIRPKYFVMENVDQILKSNKLKQAMQNFKAAGYGLSHQVLDASLCSVPQKRKRFFLLGELGGKDNAILPYLLQGISDTSMTIRDYLGDLLGVEHYYRHPRNYNRRGIFSIDEPAPTVRGVNRPVPIGYPGHVNDTAPLNGNIRPLTTIERSYLQTFPASFIFKGTKTALEQMIGNAVPVKLAEYVGRSLIDYINEVKINKPESERQLEFAFE